MGVELDLDTFSIYIADLFRNLESPESVLQESGFQEEFNILYLATLRGGIVNKNLKRVHGLLTTNIPLVKSRSFTQIFAGAVPRNNDAQLLAKVRRILCFSCLFCLH
ncbi:TPA: hypothetical protein GDO54_018514 [Pyxicephalus adspersus]|uniref:Uncharacterized protein n=1 Tax=Pyxicephalus adspersus TaxID=30357 RepID=A0AAV2ZJV6_PYXAD|nr:TPA: hypothetical protein GDO54_018514 [Pyxicephalus adspersus]